MHPTGQDTLTWIKERRRAMRISLGTHASISGGSTRSSAQKMIVSNVSEKGIRLEGCADLNVGYCYPLQFRLPTGKEVAGMAKIVWKNPEPYIQTYGAELVPLSWWEQRKLKGYLDHAAQKRDDKSAYVKIGVGLVAGMIILRSFWSLALFGWQAALFSIVMLSLYLSLAQFARVVKK